MSAIFSAIKQVIELFGFDNEVETRSYKDHFEQLWDISDQKIKSGNNIWCVVDGNDKALRWLPIGIWGRYYRSKKGIHAPILILMGDNTALKPEAKKDALYVPDFYVDEGLIHIAYSNNVVVALVQTIQKWLGETQAKKESIAEAKTPEQMAAAERMLNPEKQMSIAWQGMIYSTLSSPGRRHAVSNEIAPLVLSDALRALKDKFTQEQKDVSWYGTAALKKDKTEKAALLSLWEWASDTERISSADEWLQELPIHLSDGGEYHIRDIWGLWLNAKVLLIDDQEEDYKEILQSALKLMVCNNITLESSKTPVAINTLNDYQCLFLDLRLSEKDLKNTEYSKLPAIEFAKEVSKNDPSFPIILFTSSQQREIEHILSEHNNIITSFRKPGIAGGANSTDGFEALDKLFLAIKQALEMMENRIVYKKLKEVCEKTSVTLSYRKDGSEHDVIIIIDKNMLEASYNHIFCQKRFDKAFTFPYSYFEQHISLLRNHTMHDLIKDNPNLTALNKMRNAEAHGLSDCSQMRREAILAFCLFLDVLSNSSQCKKSYAKCVNILPAIKKKENVFRFDIREILKKAGTNQSP